MMESRASGANRLHGLLRATRVIGFSQTPVLPIVPSVDQTRCSSRQEFLSLIGKTFSGGYRARFIFGSTPPYSPDDASHLFSQGNGRFVVAAELLQSQSPAPEPIRFLETPGAEECRPGSMD